MDILIFFYNSGTIDSWQLSVNEGQAILFSSPQFLSKQKPYHTFFHYHNAS